MSRILLDTSAYAAFKRGHPRVLEVVQEAQQLSMTPVVLGELLGGFRQGSRERENRKDLEVFLQSPRVRVLTVDEETAQRYADIYHGLRKAGTPVPTNDVWIAASAMQYGHQIVTLDRHFSLIAQVAVDLVEPIR